MKGKNRIYTGLCTFLAVCCLAVGIDVFYRNPKTGTGGITQMIQKLGHGDLENYDISGFVFRFESASALFTVNPGSVYFGEIEKVE